MKRKILLSLALLLGYHVQAQYSQKFVIKSIKDKESLSGTTVTLNGTDHSNIADNKGLVMVSNIPAGDQIVRFSHIGFKNKEVDIHFPGVSQELFEVFLETEIDEMSEVIITSTRTNDTLKNTPTRIEAIIPEELDEKGTMRPGDIKMLLNESTGITTQQISAVSGIADIRMLGLDGRYTQLLKDGMPLYSGFSGGLSILQIPPLDLKQVEYIKGSVSTLYGGGAIAGLVNLITRTPAEKRELNFLVNGNSAFGFDGNGFYAEKWKTIGVTIFGAYHYNRAYDPPNIGLTAIPKTNRVTFNPKLFLYLDDKTKGWFGINTTIENRIGGDLNVIEGHTDSLRQFFERNKTLRISTQLSLMHIINNSSWIVI